MNYSFGKIEKVIFLGGGKILLKMLTNIENRFEKVVFTSKNFIEENINGLNFEQHLKNLNIKYYVVDNLNDNEEIAREIIPSYTLGFSISARWIIKQNIIDLFGGKLVNLHGARLPQNRGGGGMSWNIMQGNKIDGFTFHFITTGIDDGDIVLSEEFVYPDSCKVPLDYDNYKSDKEFVSGMDFFEKISNGHFFNIKKQQEEYSSYFSRLNTNIHGYINWNWSLDEILKFINAFDEPYEGASSYINGVLVKIKKATVTYTDGIFHPFQKGIIYRKNNIGVFVATEQGTLIIEDIKDNEGNDFINSIKLGDRIFTPQSKIDEAFTTRVFYNDKGLKLK